MFFDIFSIELQREKYWFYKLEFLNLAIKFHPEIVIYRWQAPYPKLIMVSAKIDSQIIDFYKVG